jgi:hypothetical protein
VCLGWVDCWDVGIFQPIEGGQQQHDAVDEITATMTDP